MKDFTVTVYEQVLESVTVTVKARNEAEAIDKAKNKVIEEVHKRNFVELQTRWGEVHR